MGTSMINRLMKIVKSGALSRFDVSSVRQICIGGASLKEETLNDIRQSFTNAIVFQCYGKYLSTVIYLKKRVLLFIIIFFYE